MISKTSLPSHPDFAAGEVLLINKEINWTSFDVVNSIKIYLKYEYELRKIKIGHAGTLDPKASGLMIVCAGRQTKSIDTFQAFEKEYTGAFTLGLTTPSWDTETLPDQTYPTEHITPEMIGYAAKQLTGTILQRPPSFSAIWVDGKRAYKIARKDSEFRMEPRQVEVTAFEITGIEMPLVHFRIRCSKGTYIRALANDFGKVLGSGAFLSVLCRTAIGEFRLEDALTISEFKEIYKNPDSEL